VRAMVAKETHPVAIPTALIHRKPVGIRQNQPDTLLH